MATLSFNLGVAGKTAVVLFTDTAGLRYNGSAMADPSTIALASYATGLVATAEKLTSNSVGTGIYVCTVPAAIESNWITASLLDSADVTAFIAGGSVPMSLYDVERASLSPSYDAAKNASSSTSISNLQSHGDSNWATADVTSLTQLTMSGSSEAGANGTLTPCGIYNGKLVFCKEATPRKWNYWDSENSRWVYGDENPLSDLPYETRGIYYRVDASPVGDYTGENPPTCSGTYTAGGTLADKVYAAGYQASLANKTTPPTAEENADAVAASDLGEKMATMTADYQQRNEATTLPTTAPAGYGVSTEQAADISAAKASAEIAAGIIEDGVIKEEALINVNSTPVVMPLTSQVVSGEIARKLLAVYQHEEKHIQITFSGSNGTAVDLSGKSIEVILFDASTNETLFTLPATVTAETNVIDFATTAESTATPGDYGYQIWSLTDKATLQGGVFRVLPGANPFAGSE